MVARRWVGEFRKSRRATFAIAALASALSALGHLDEAEVGESGCVPWFRNGTTGERVEADQSSFLEL